MYLTVFKLCKLLTQKVTRIDVFRHEKGNYFFEALLLLHEPSTASAKPKCYRMTLIPLHFWLIYTWQLFYSYAEQYSMGYSTLVANAFIEKGMKELRLPGNTCI